MLSLLLVLVARVAHGKRSWFPSFSFGGGPPDATSGGGGVTTAWHLYICDHDAARSRGPSTKQEEEEEEEEGGTCTHAMGRTRKDAVMSLLKMLEIDVRPDGKESRYASTGVDHPRGTLRVLVASALSVPFLVLAHGVQALLKLLQLDWALALWNLAVASLLGAVLLPFVKYPFLRTGAIVLLRAVYGLYLGVVHSSVAALLPRALDRL